MQVSNFLDLREQNQSFSDLAGFAGIGVGDRQLTGTGEPERLTSVPVTQNFFPLLGVQPAIGRSFTDGGVPGEIQHSAGRAVELRLLAEAVCFRPGGGGTEADAEQQAGDGGGRAACVLRFREHFCARHSGRSRSFHGP